MTIVITHPGADFSARNIGAIPLEPPIEMPQDDLFAYFRLGRTMPLSLRNMASGGTDAASSGENVVKPLAIETAVGGYLDIPGVPPVAPLTIITVFLQTAANPPGTVAIAGVARAGGGADGMGITRSSSTGNYAAVARRSGSNVSASLTAAGGERHELLAAVFDSGAGEIKIRRPRTDTQVVTANSTWPAVASPHRLAGGNDGTATASVESLLHIAYARALSSGEIDAIYVSAKASLGARGVSI